MVEQQKVIIPQLVLNITGIVEVPGEEEDVYAYLK